MHNLASFRKKLSEICEDFVKSSLRFSRGPNVLTGRESVHWIILSFCRAEMPLQSLIRSLYGKALSSGQFNAEDNDAHEQTDKEKNEQCYPDDIEFGADVNADNLFFRFDLAIVGDTFCFCLWLIIPYGYIFRRDEFYGNLFDSPYVY